MNIKICIVGLGYVGLPLAVEFGKKYETIGFDINPDRIYELNNFRDKTNELSQEEIRLATKLIFTYKKETVTLHRFFFVNNRTFCV